MTAGRGDRLPLAELRELAEIKAMADPLAKFCRRDVLGSLLGLAAVVIPRSARPAAGTLPDILPAPTRRPEPGLVEIALDAAPARLSVAGRPAELWAYGGSFPGPLLRVREGETVRLRFANRLPEATNLHFHGLRIPPAGRADNVWLHIPPGETFMYEFQVPRGIAGTYWYHPHAHGTLARQLWAG
ncbi:MAG: multicopper oxidase domain-containing protein, partial [Geminicoccaceae bacterium]